MAQSPITSKASKTSTAPKSSKISKVSKTPKASKTPNATKASTAATPTHRRVRFLVISDTHSAQPLGSEKLYHAFRHPMHSVDVLLHCGDLTITSTIKENKSAIDLLDSIPAELKLVIPGNHDMNLDESYDGQMIDLMRGLQRKEEDAQEEKKEVLKMWAEAEKKKKILLLKEGLHRYTLASGATFSLYASPYQPEFHAMAYAYPRDQDRFNTQSQIPDNLKITSIATNPIPSFPAVDILITHGPPHNHLDTVTRYGPVRHPGCENIMRALTRARPRMHCFGHIHEGWGVERVTWREGTDDTNGNNEGRGREMNETRYYAEASAETVPTNSKRVVMDRAAYIDVSESSSRPLRFGKETMLVNAAIMDVKYQPENAPWVVDLDLPVTGAGSSNA